MARPLLAVCIPTHHGRARLLGELLDRLLPQIPPNGSVEVCVSDNASRDGTAEQIARRRSTIGDGLRYRRAETDQGLAANLFAVVEMADAEYCWLLGSDDAPAEEAIPRLLTLLRANPGTSGAHVGFFRRTNEDLDAPGVDLPPYILPRAARSMRLHTVAEHARECGVMALPLSCNVVHRNRWRSVVALEREQAERTPITPHVYVIGRMIQKDPDWLWCEDRLTLLREAPVFLVEEDYMGEEGEDLGRQFLAISGDLDRAWSALHGRGSSLHRALIGTLARYVLHAAAAAVIKLNYADGPRDDLRYLGFARLFWRSRDFRRKTLPVLLTPTRLFRVPEGGPEAPLPEGEPARLSAEMPREMIARRGGSIKVLVENTGHATLSFARPHFAALYARWSDPETGRTVEDRMYNTPLYPPVRPGRSRRLEQLLTVPGPGIYELTIDLFSRDGNRSLTWAPLRSTVEVKSPTHTELPATTRSGAR